MSNKNSLYKLSPLAYDDLEQIWSYTFQSWSLEQADSYLSDIALAFEGLACGIKKGRPVDVREGYLKYAVGTHLIFFRQSDEEIIIIRILHQQMDANRHL